MKGFTDFTFYLYLYGKKKLDGHFIKTKPLFHLLFLSFLFFMALLSIMIRYLLVKLMADIAIHWDQYFNCRHLWLLVSGYYKSKRGYIVDHGFSFLLLATFSIL
jgi:hypothetical protein